MRRLLLASLLALSACPAPQVPDAGGPVDSGPPPPPCDSPEDCRAADYPGVCRQGACAKDVPCADDLECGLGEACIDRACAFVGCVNDDDCPTGRCRPQTFTCAECGEDSDCPFNRPICQAATQKCVQCLTDAQCEAPGPSHCEAISGACTHCLSDEHCPNGLTCSGGICAGAQAGQQCPTGTACAEGLTCVTLGGVQTCLQGCNAYAPTCPTGQICYTLKYSASSSYVFDMGGLLGVCFTPIANARNYRDSCEKDVAGNSNCQPSLACVPDSPASASCRAYCDPGALGACPSGEICHRFPGDFYGRQYGLCYADNGWGDRCTADTKCRPGQSCQPYEDPSTFEELSPACLFNVGAAAGLSPCASVTTADGGAVQPDRVCASGACRGDSFPSTPPYFCFAACATDSDCTIGSRTGSCDGTYQFPTPGGVNAFITGCRPGCASNSTCEEYGVDGGLVCRPRLLTGSTNSGLKLNCGRPNAGGSGAGAPCVTSSQCTSGYCSFDDARGVRRQGYCLEACQTAADCAATSDGGLASGPLDCLPTTYLGYRGQDFTAGTPDDVLSVRSVCSGISCDEDEDCSADGGARCVPDVSPADAGAYVLRCRPRVQGLNREAGQSCTTNTECSSGACGQLGDSTRVCYRACDPAGAATCPAGLTCRAGAFRFTATAGNFIQLDGCAP